MAGDPRKHLVDVEEFLVPHLQSAPNNLKTALSSIRSVSELEDALPKLTKQFGRDLVENLSKGAAASYMVGSAKGSYTLGVSYDLPSSEALKYAVKYRDHLVNKGTISVAALTPDGKYKTVTVPWLKDVTAECRDSISEIVKEAIANGTSYGDVAKQLGEHLEETYKNRMVTIARTEIARHAVNGAIARYKDADVATVELINGNDPCEDCQAAAGEYPIEDCPEVPLHPNCCCDIVPRSFKEDTSSAEEEISVEEEVSDEGIPVEDMTPLSSDDPKNLEFLSDDQAQSLKDYLRDNGDSVADGPWTTYSTAHNEAQLSRAEFIGLDNYKSLGYEGINGILRDADLSRFTPSQLESYKKDIGMIDSAIEKSSVPGGHKVYRGVGVDSGEKIINSKIGETYDDLGFQSFSLNPNTSTSFASETGTVVNDYDHVSVVLRSVTREGEAARYMDNTEYEVLYPRGTQWTIMDKNLVEFDKYGDGFDIRKILVVDIKRESTP